MIEKACTAEDRQRIECVTTRRFLTRIGELAEKYHAESSPAEASAGKTVLGETLDVTDEERKKVREDHWTNINRNKQRDRKPPESGAK
jgi:hypothetical protein